MPACTEAHQLTRLVEIRPTLKIFAFELDWIDQHLLWSRLAGERRNRHVLDPLMALDRASHSRSQPRTERSCGRWKTSLSRQYSESPCAPIRRGRCEVGRASDPHRDRIGGPPDACSDRRVSAARRRWARKSRAH